MVDRSPFDRRTQKRARCRRPLFAREAVAPKFENARSTCSARSSDTSCRFKQGTIAAARDSGFHSRVEAMVPTPVERSRNICGQADLRSAREPHGVAEHNGASLSDDRNQCDSRYPNDEPIAQLGLRLLRIPGGGRQPGCRQTGEAKFVKSYSRAISSISRSLE